MSSNKLGKLFFALYELFFGLRRGKSIISRVSKLCPQPFRSQIASFRVYLDGVVM